MRILRLYANKPDIFAPINFNSGLSVILAEIRRPRELDVDVHNLGKSTIGRLIDFCLLKGKSGEFFLFKNKPVFDSFVFYLEIELSEGDFLTIGRPVVPGSKISFRRGSSELGVVGDHDIVEWDHVGLPFRQSKLVLDGALATEGLGGWPFRKLVGYLVRSQRDYADVFQLSKFAGPHKDWKPFVSQLVGLDGAQVADLYEKRDELSDMDGRIAELGSVEVADASVLDGMIAVKEIALEGRTRVLETFDFYAEDARVSEALAANLEKRIATLNDERFGAERLLSQIESSLSDTDAQFDPGVARTLFEDAGVLLGDQVTKTYEQLVAFNKSINVERRESLSRQRAVLASRIEELARELRVANAERADAIAFLRESQTLEKYQSLSREISEGRAEIIALRERRASLQELLDLRRDRRLLAEEVGRLRSEVEHAVEVTSADSLGTFGRMRQYFAEIIREVLDADAILSIRVNDVGGLDFSADFVSGDGVAVDSAEGASYLRLLCVAFDLAMLRSHSDVRFPRFVYHDGILEQLEVRKRANLLRVLHRYAEFGMQPIITAIDGEIPVPESDKDSLVASSDVIKLLHDEDASGRLFQMDPW